MPRWLFVDDVPSLGGESALALIRLLDGLAESIGSEYMAEIEACRVTGHLTALLDRAVRV